MAYRESIALPKAGPDGGKRLKIIAVSPEGFRKKKKRTQSSDSQIMSHDPLGGGHISNNLNIGYLHYDS